MPKRTASEEAYLLGCLFGRGSIEVTKSGDYQLVFRIPFREYSPVSVEIIKALLKDPDGLTAKKMLTLPKLRAYGVSNLGLLLNRLRTWHPPRKQVKVSMLKREDAFWKLNSTKLANEFLKWQELYLEREKAGMEFVLQHLTETTTFLATNPLYQEVISEFGIINHIIKCEITEKTFLDLKTSYGLEEGDVYRHARVPRSIFNFPRDALYEFVRGLADTIATIDVWLIPRIQFSIINDNYGLPVDLCAILQEKLAIPVYYIGWAGTYAERKSRDHLVKVWVINFDELRFRWPLFYNKRKQEEFLEHLEVAKKKIGKKEDVPWLEPCPSGRKKVGYMKACIEHGCKRPQKYRGRPLEKWLPKAS